MLVTAESCTGGLIGKYMTDLPGSSRVFWGGFLTYADDAKSMLVGVGKEMLQTQGAVSEETVTAMAQGALSHSGADVSVAVSGIAGPDGGHAGKACRHGLDGGGAEGRRRAVSASGVSRASVI